MNDELAERLYKAGVVTTPEQLEAIRNVVAMIVVSRGAYDPIKTVVALLRPPPKWLG